LLISGVTAKADRLVMKGSDTLGAKLVPQLAEAFKAKNPGTTRWEKLSGLCLDSQLALLLLRCIPFACWRHGERPGNFAAIC
jgi:hypothetical protein